MFVLFNKTLFRYFFFDFYGKYFQEVIVISREKNVRDIRCQMKTKFAKVITLTHNFRNMIVSIQINYL